MKAGTIEIMINQHALGLLQSFTLTAELSLMKMFRAAILTAKEVEFDAVRRHLVDERRADGSFDGTVYRRT